MQTLGGALPVSEVEPRPEAAAEPRPVAAADPRPKAAAEPKPKAAAEPRSQPSPQPSPTLNIVEEIVGGLPIVLKYLNLLNVPTAILG